MKIVIVVEEFNPSKGYLEYYLARELTKRSHKVFVFTFGSRKRILREKLDEGFEVIRMPRVITAIGMNLPGIREIVYVLRFIKKEKPDIIHCQPLYSPLSLILINCNYLSPSKIVGSLITGEYSINSAIANLKYAFAKIITEHLLKNKTASFFVINDGWKKITLRLFNIPDLKIKEIPLGADAELFKPDDQTRNTMRNQLGLFPDDLVVVYSGKIIQSKKLETLFQALAPIIRQNQKVKLLLVGTGDSLYRKRLEELASRLGISYNVIFNSWVTRTKLPDFYNASDIAVWPGSVSISIIEAASVGLPVIIKRSPITSFAIANGNGFAFELGNVDELRAKLITLIDNEELRKEMGRRSRYLVEHRLNWESVAKQYLRIYKML
jgi:glycosyltransferase involved in cell wall biosynthesis